MCDDADECRAEIQSLFDVQIDGIMKRITEQLNWLSEHGHTEQVVSVASSNEDCRSFKMPSFVGLHDLVRWTRQFRLRTR